MPELSYELHNEKKLFSIMDERNSVFFLDFYRGTIFYIAELFDCEVNFKFYLKIFIFLNINTNQTSKEQYSN